MTLEAGSYAIDTNIAIALLNGDPDVSARWSEADIVVLPAPVLGELLYGARRSSRRVENEEAVRRLAGSMRLIACDETVCEQYAHLKAALAQKGRPIPENDIWIAACVVIVRATLVTRDSHFREITELHCEEW